MLDCQKHLFSLRPDVHNLNCAYKGPLLQSVETAAVASLQRNRNPTDISQKDFFKEVAEVRQLFAQLIHCAPEEVALVPSVSYGMASALNNVAFSKGKHAISIDGEFPSGYFTLKRWCEEHGADLRIVGPDKTNGPVGEAWTHRILESINGDTAAVVMSSVHWMNGLKFDLAEIGQKCRSVGAKLIVDGTQSVGALPMDVKAAHVDALICGGYKWLLGPYSVGLAYLGPAFHQGRPLEESWMNRTNAEDFSRLSDYSPDYLPGAARFNVGESSNFILMPMMKAALKQILAWSPENVQAYAKALGRPLVAYLKELGGEMESERFQAHHLMGIRLPEGFNGELLKEKLLENKVYLSVRGDFLRVSVNVFNTPEDIAKLIEVIEAVR